MTTAVQHRRGTTAEHATFTGLEGEVTIDTTKDTAVIHDGVLAGGYPLAKENLANVTTSGLSSIDGASTASDDKFFIYDQSATSLKTITRAELNNAMEQDALANVAITGGTINGTTIGNTTAAAASVTTLTTSSTVTHNGGTANGVAYLNGSKVLTTGSALTFESGSLFVKNGGLLNSLSPDGSVQGWLSAANSGQVDIAAYNGSGTAYIAFKAGTASEQMRLTSTGLGIGTTSPATTLHVVGGERLESTASTGAAGPIMTFYRSNTTAMSSQLAGSLQFNRLLTDGTTNAAANITVWGNNSAASPSSYIAYNALSSHRWQFSGSEYMRLDATGLGIGTSSPGYKLDIAGGTSVTGGWYTTARFENSGATQGIHLGYNTSTVNSLIAAVEAGSGLEIWTNNGAGGGWNAKATLDKYGNLGLGVTPSNSTIPAIQSNYGLLIGNIDTDITNNAYYNGEWKYVGAGTATLYQMDSGAHYWYTAGSGTAGNAISFTQAMTLDASGRLMVGQTSGFGPLNVQASGSGYSLISTNDATLNYSQIYFAQSTVSAYTYIRGDGRSTGYLSFGTNDIERLRIDSSGNLLVGTTSVGAGNSFTVNLNAGNGAYTQTSHPNGTGSGVAYAQFLYNGSNIGSITQNGTTGVLYNLTSDYRLKNNAVALTGSGAFIDALQPKTWDWWDGSGKGVGFIAHEFMEVAKYSGNGEKDAVDADGKPVYQSIQPSSSEVMANIIAELQSLRARVAQLESN